MMVAPIAADQKVYVTYSGVIWMMTVRATRTLTQFTNLVDLAARRYDECIDRVGSPEHRLMRNGKVITLTFDEDLHATVRALKRTSVIRRLAIRAIAARHFCEHGDGCDEC